MCPMIELGPWTPDQPEVANGGLVLARNTIPAARGYDSLPSLSATNSGALNTACRGAFTGRTRLGTNFTVAGTANRLYLATTGTLANVSNGGASPYTISTNDNWWSFILFGNRIVASSYTDAMESFVVGTSANFAALSADSPRCKHLAVVKDFVVAGNLIGRGVNAATIGTAEDAIQWSALDDPTSWPQVGTSAAKSVQSDWQPLSGDGGQVTDLTGGSDFGIVFQERAIWRMDYEGGDTFFRFTPIDENKGCWIHKAAIRVGNLTYFPAEDGFHATDGLQTVPIGNEVVDQFFIDQFQADKQAFLSVAYFPEWKCVAWLFMGENATNNTPNTVMLFNVQSQMWSHGLVTAQWLVDVLPFATSLDSDATSLDSGTYSAVSLDSLVGAARRTAGAFNVSHTLATFTGTPGTAIFQTHQFEPAEGRVGYVRSIRPVSDESASMSVLVRGRMRSNDPLVAASTDSEDATGKHAVRITGRYLDSRFFLFGTFRNFQGFDVDVVPRGTR